MVRAKAIVLAIVLLPSVCFAQKWIPIALTGGTNQAPILYSLECFGNNGFMSSNQVLYPLNAFRRDGLTIKAVFRPTTLGVIDGGIFGFTFSSSHLSLLSLEQTITNGEPRISLSVVLEDESIKQFDTVAMTALTNGGWHSVVLKYTSNTVSVINNFTVLVDGDVRINTNVAAGPIVPVASTPRWVVGGVGRWIDFTVHYFIGEIANVYVGTNGVDDGASCPVITGSTANYWKLNGDLEDSTVNTNRLVPFSGGFPTFIHPGFSCE